jgi:hypothetical protein
VAIGLLLTVELNKPALLGSLNRNGEANDDEMANLFPARRLEFTTYTATWP